MFDLSSEAGLPVSTTYRLLNELERYDLVYREGNGTVSLGVKAVALGRAAEARLHDRLVVPARPVVARAGGGTAEDR